MDVETAWVKPPPQIGGLDHLAVQAPCINVYGRLLPGITNVTDRARYYSFYPWLIWAFDQRGFTTYDADFIERFRRADCLFSLIAERHSAVAEGDYEDHAGAIVGSNTLASIGRDLSEGDTVTDADSEVADEIEIPDDFAKKGGGRRIPMSEDLRGALVALKGARGDKALDR